MANCFLTRFQERCSPNQQLSVHGTKTSTAVETEHSDLDSDASSNVIPNAQAGTHTITRIQAEQNDKDVDIMFSSIPASNDTIIQMITHTLTFVQAEQSDKDRSAEPIFAIPKCC